MSIQLQAVSAPEPVWRVLELRERESFAPCRVWNPGPSSQQSVAIQTATKYLEEGKIFGTLGVNGEE
jgi:hypothetical protein